MPPQLADAGPRFLALSALLVFLAVAWLLGACAPGLKPELTVHGTLAKVERDTRYEAPCGILARIHKACDDLPVCCAYKAIVVDSAGQRTEFYAFWPAYVQGLLGLVPLYTEATFHLRRDPIYRLPCNYTCGYDLSYVLEADQDVTP